MYDVHAKTHKNSLKKGVCQMLYQTLNFDVLTLAQRLASVNKMSVMGNTNDYSKETLKIGR